MVTQRMSNNKKIVKEILEIEVYPIFLANSFKKKGDTLFVAGQDVVKYADLEYFRFNTPNTFFYWFNFYFFGGDFQNEKDVNIKILLTKGVTLFKKRLGYLWNDDNHMYQLTNDINQQALAQRMKTDVIQYLMPLFERINNLDDIIKFLLEENQKLEMNYYSLTIAIVLAKAGRIKESRKFLLESSAPQEIVQKTAKIYGIDLNK